MIQRLALLFTVVANFCWPLYTKSHISAFRVLDNAIVIDGQMDPVWKKIANTQSGLEKMDLKDCSKLVNIKASSDYKLQNQDPCLDSLSGSEGLITLLSAYDSQFVYLYFLVREVEVFDGSQTCGAPSVWKADAVEIFMDPNPWNEQSYHSIFSKDGSGRWFGTSPLTVQINKPIAPLDWRLFLKDRTVNDQFDLRSQEDFIAGNQFEVKSAVNPIDKRIISLEFKIPHWGDSLFWQAGDSLYFTFGYNNYTSELFADCSELPRAYRWAKNYKRYGMVQYPGWRASEDSVHYDPSRSADGWGKMVLQPHVIIADSEQVVPCILDVNCTGEFVGIRYISQKTNKSLTQLGNTLQFSSVTEGMLEVMSMNGSVLSVIPIQQNIADLSSSGLKPGYYVAKVKGRSSLFRLLIY